MLGEFQLGEHPFHHRASIVLARIRRQPKFGGIVQRLADRQLAVYNVVLRHHADPRPERRIVRVHVVSVEGDLPGRRFGDAAEQPDQRRLARARRSDHRREGAGPGVERDVGEQLVAVDGESDLAYLDATGRDCLPRLDRGTAGEHQIRVADGDDVTGTQGDGLDPVPVDESAIARTVVVQLRSGGGGHQVGVNSGGQRIFDLDGRSRVSPDGDGPRGRTRRALWRGGGLTRRWRRRLPLNRPWRQWRSRLRRTRGRRLWRRLPVLGDRDDLCGGPEMQLRSVRSTDSQDEVVTDDSRRHTRPVGEDSVAGLVDCHPLTDSGIHPDDQMQPGHHVLGAGAGVRDPDVRGLATTDGDLLAGREGEHCAAERHDERRDGAHECTLLTGSACSSPRRRWTARPGTPRSG